MNEELKIVIKAISDEAKKKIGEVKKELEGVEKTGKNAGKTVDKALGAIGKGALMAVGSVVALTTAMVALGKRSMEFQKIQSRLISGFQGVGLSAAQANKTFTGLYRFLGEDDTALEAANLLAQITQSEQDLAEWTTILQGVYAKFPSSLPVESLAEAANETIKVGKITGTLADAVNWLGVSEDALNEKLAATTSLSEREALIRNTLSGLYSHSAQLYEKNNAALLAHNESQARLNQALAEATKWTIPLMTALNNLAAVVMNVLGPAFRIVSAVVIVFVEWIIAAVQFIGSFFGILAKKSTDANKAIQSSTSKVQQSLGSATSGASGLGNALGDAAKQAKELRKQTAGFDELNVMSSPTAASAGSVGNISGAVGGVGDFAIPEISSDAFGLDDFSTTLEDVRKKAEGILVIVGLIAGALLTWKIVDFISELSTAKKALEKMGESTTFTGKLLRKMAQEKLDTLNSKLKKIGGTMMIVAGGILLALGYSDAWANGIDWGNLAMTLSGLGLIIGGIALQFGPMAAAIATIVGGIALLILGIKDLITNGYSMEAVITVAVGAIATLVGVVWALNGALLANPITWIVVAIMALVAAFVILWNECEGFRNFWIGLWNGIVKAFNATVDWLGQACQDIGQFFVDAWNWIAGIWNGAGAFFSGLWEAIKRPFAAVGSWFKNTFESAWRGVKNVFSAGGQIFNGIKEGIAGVFTTVVNSIIRGINTVIAIPFNTINGILNFIRNISIVGYKPFKGLWGQNPLAVPQIPLLAKGGIVDSATLAMIGERGKEAVVPLENNTEWMDRLADRISSRNNQPSKIVLTLDGNELGWANIRSINNITEQTGSLQLVLA